LPKFENNKKTTEDKNTKKISPNFNKKLSLTQQYQNKFQQHSTHSTPFSSKAHRTKAKSARPEVVYATRQVQAPV
jgi:hypothetical protein